MNRVQNIINHLTPLCEERSQVVSNAQKADIGLIGLAVMGENLVLNMASKGFKVACFNRTVARVDEFIQGRAKSYPGIIGCKTPAELVRSLSTPRKIMIMVRAGQAIDQTIDHILPYLEKGDIVIDGGNSNFIDTQRRIDELKPKGIRFMGVGVSGGEEGALHGPSIMPGGSNDAWEYVKPIFQKISAKVEDGSPCCDYVGEGGSGHFVKMVHNGIEYGDMQLIAETYLLLKNHVGLNNEEIAQVFDHWNKGELESYLIEITRDIFRKKDEETGKYVIDIILDRAGQKGTGKWTVESGLDSGAPITLIAEAVFARTLSNQKEQRVAASRHLKGPQTSPLKTQSEKTAFIKDLHDALYASKLVSYAQGFTLLRAAAKDHKWNLNYGGIALMWRGGCIIRSKFLAKIKNAFDKNRDLDNLLLDNFFMDVIHRSQAGWRRVSAAASLHGYAIPAIYSSLSYYDGLRTAQSTSNLIQAQRDFFGAHTYERVDKPQGKFFHTNWSGQGGSTASSVYNA